MSAAEYPRANQPIAGEGAIGENGWRRDQVWQYDAGGGQWGDDAVGIGFTAYYSEPEGKWAAEVSYYVIESATTNLPVVEQAWAVEYRSEVYLRADKDHEPPRT